MVYKRLRELAPLPEAVGRRDSLNLLQRNTHCIEEFHISAKLYLGKGDGEAGVKAEAESAAGRTRPRAAPRVGRLPDEDEPSADA